MKHLILLSFLSGVYLTAAAQGSEPSRVPNQGIEITFHNGLIYAGSGHSMRSQLRNAGFNVDKSKGGSRTLFSFLDDMSRNKPREEASAQLGVIFPVKEKYKVKGLYNYRETAVRGISDMDSQYEVFRIETSSHTVAAVGFAPLATRLFRVGVGPAFHLVNAKPIYDEKKLSKNNYFKPGMVIESGFSSSSGKSFYFDIQLQYFYIGNADLGSYSIKANNYEETSSTKTVDLYNSKFSSLSLGLGVGFRLKNRRA